jgi:hypothetical protein
MHRSGHDVRASLQECARLPADYERGRCEGGVMMENTMQHLHVDSTSFREKALRACEGLDVSPSLLELCYGQVGEMAMFAFRHDLPQASALCAALSTPEARRACAQGAEEEQRTVKEERERLRSARR